MKTKTIQPIVCPFLVICDTREQFPFGFQGIRGRASQKNRPLIVPVKLAGLTTGDYSIEGLEDWITIERKSLADLFGTILGDRERFERELSRMQAIASHADPTSGAADGFACVICEGRWTDGPPRRQTESDEEFNERSGRQFRSVLGSIRAWRMEFPRVHWLECASRRQAEVECYRILEMFWRKREHERESTNEPQPKQTELIL